MANEWIDLGDGYTAKLLVIKKKPEVAKKDKKPAVSDAELAKALETLRKAGVIA